MSATDWQDQAACRDDDTGLFDYDPETDPARKAEDAKALCVGCQVRGACLGFALSQPADEDLIGIYGGLTSVERSELRQREPRQAEPRRLWYPGTDPRFAQVSFALASEIGVVRTAEALGVAARTLHRAWKRHGLGPRRTMGQPTQPEAAPWLIEDALRRLSRRSLEARHHDFIADPEFAVSSFELAGKLGRARAAARLGVHTTTLYRAWDRHELGRPDSPLSWTRRLLNDRGLAERAFAYARRTSILAAASEFQTSAPTLRRAFDRHGLGHPHAGLDPEELHRRWNEQPGPDHRNRIQRREYRARRAAERRAAPSATPPKRPAGPLNKRARRSRDNRDEERSR